MRELGGQDRHAKRCRDFLHLFRMPFCIYTADPKVRCLCGNDICGFSGMLFSGICPFAPAGPERLTRLPQRVTERLTRLPQPTAERLAYLAVRLRG